MKNYKLPLFPLNVVACPGGLVSLRIFEGRYLNMVRNCVNNKSSFAIVAILPEGETDPEGIFPFADVGTLMEIKGVDDIGSELMMILCEGHHRVKVKSFIQQRDGLFVGDVSDIDDDISIDVPEDLLITSINLKRHLISLPSENFLLTDILIAEPCEFDDASWVSNRWIELLDIPLVQKQLLMELDSPILRLELIQDILGLDSAKSI
jgi:hypothetical protein